jgi:hypothetical protein
MAWHWGDLTKESGANGSSSSAPASHVAAAEGTQHVFYRLGAQIWELWWRRAGTPQGDALTGGNVLPARGDPTSHVLDDGKQHVFYRTSQGEIAELRWLGGETKHARSLNDEAGRASDAVSDPASHVFDGTQHVFYRTPQGQSVELGWTGGGGGTPQSRVLTPPGAPLAVGDPASHVFAADGTQHVFYRTGAGEIVELVWTSSDQPAQVRNFTELSGGALPSAGDPVSHVFAGEGTQHVFYAATTSQIVELWWRGSDTGPQFENLTERAGGGPVPSGKLASHVFEAEGTQHVFFRTDSFSSGHPDPAIVELWWGGGAPHFENLNLRSGADVPPGLGPVPSPPPGSDPTCHVFVDERTQHVFYAAQPDTDTRLQPIIELWFNA